MNKKILITIIFFLVMLIGVVASLQIQAAHGDRYVRGKYGEHCYNVEDSNGSIRYGIYFDTIEDCLKSLQ